MSQMVSLQEKPPGALQIKMMNRIMGHIISKVANAKTGEKGLEGITPKRNRTYGLKTP